MRSKNASIHCYICTVVNSVVRVLCIAHRRIDSSTIAKEELKYFFVLIDTLNGNLLLQNLGIITIALIEM